MTDEELFDRIDYLEQGIRFWRALALGLAAAFALFLVIGAVAGVSLFSQAAAHRVQAEQARLEAEVMAQQAQQARREAEANQQRAEQLQRAEQERQQAEREAAKRLKKD